MSAIEKHYERPPMSGKPNLPPSAERCSISATSLPVSDISRESLRRDMHRLKRSLTPNENIFLEYLVTNGDDSQIEIARQKLNDSSIFFSSDETIGEHKEIHSTDNEWNESSTNCLERNLSDNSIEYSSSRSGNEMNSNPKHYRRQGSLKLQQHMENRRNSIVHKKIWRAHETGLSITRAGSVKAVMNRGSFRRSRSSSGISSFREQILPNASSLSSATQELLINGGPVSRPDEDQIFRQNNDSSHTKEKKQRDRNGSFPPVQSLVVPQPFNRILSDGSRKSVTFEHDTFSPRDLLSSKPTQARRQFSTDSLGVESIESFPALHHVHPVRSSSIGSTHHSSSRPKQARRQFSVDSLGGESTATVESFPALKHAHPIRSNSISSIPSLHHGRTIRSDSLIELMSGEDRDPAWSSPIAKRDSDSKNLSSSEVGEASKISKPLLLRGASCNSYQGEGIEVSYLTEEAVNVNKAREYGSMAFPSDSSIRSTLSWDERSNREMAGTASLVRSFSDDDLSTNFLGRSKSLLRFESRTSLRSIADVNISDEDLEDRSWDMNSESEHPNAWNVLKDPYSVGYGAEGTLPFRIFGTSADDESAQPHVLSPPLMESLQQFLPFEISEQNFWMKYSLLRDGASMLTLLQNARGAKNTILAIETSDGDVFGSFTSEPWRKSWRYFGTGESFLWRMRQSRKVACRSIIDQAQMESELDVYPWMGENNCVQLCTHDKIAIGGGTMSQEKKDEHASVSEPAYGFGLAVDQDLHFGTSSHCATFGSPPLCKLSPSDPFEIINLELWTLTPCADLEDAERLELGMLFLSSQ